MIPRHQPAISTLGRPATRPTIVAHVDLHDHGMANHIAGGTREEVFVRTPVAMTSERELAMTDENEEQDCSAMEEVYAV
ncbi:hypothetical protein N7G274_000905 [Stereocaulon virgatum]|uniref:Uncharacterized protein n=1 Tax=Stereocaulon virgatum TaxID=373712 RepID=A0ABR4AMB3_9LECA